MLRSYITIALRNFYKFRFYTLINVIGLTTGITACLVILFFVQFELSYDRFNTYADRIVRVDWDLQLGDVRTYKAAVTPPMAEVLVHDFPEVEVAARLRDLGAFQFKRDIENTVEWRVIYADNDLFKVFTIPFVAGDARTALKEPNSMVITEACAKQFFPNEEALGKTLTKDNQTLYKITGVVKDLPENSHFHYRIFLSMEGLAESKNGNWIGGPFNTYLLLRPGADAKVLESKLPGIVEKYLLPNAEAALGSSFMKEFKESHSKLTLRLRPLTDIHLYSHMGNELEGNGDINNVYLFGAIAIVILIIACINFVNLTTARSARRAREIGIRKVMGSGRLSLTAQFIGESTLLTTVSFMIALGLAELVLPIFNSITGMNLEVPFQDVGLGILLLMTAVLVGVISGIYPGVVLSAFQPAQVLKGNVKGNRSSFLRSGLVVFQFAISTFLIISTLALHEQMDFMRNKKLGFKKEQVILLHAVKNVGDRLITVKDEILRSNIVKTGTVSSYFPGPGSARQTPLMWKYGAQPLPENSFNGEKWMVDYDYVPTLGIEILEGRNFSRDIASDSSGVILNESAIKRLGFTDSPVGHKISLLHDNPDGSHDQTKLETWEIIGVARNFNFESLHESVAPLGLFFGNGGESIAFSYETENTHEVISALEKKWKALAPGEPFHYAFLDENFQRMFTTEAKTGKLFALFSGLAIVIACLGLFALTAYTAEQRAKEIGIRKVMGATIQNILLLLSRDFGKLILLGFLLATPLAAYGISWYLQGYAFRTQISWLIYIGAALITFMLAMFTMGYQSILAARTNPVESLKNE